MGNVQRLGRRLPGLFQLIAIAEHRSINKAADALNISQSSLTRSLAALEAEIGVTLFERSARGVRLTAPGEIALVHAVAIHKQIKGLKHELDAFAAARPKPLRVGATPLVESLFLAPALHALQERFPKTTVRLIEGSRPDLLAKLRLQELDVVLSTFPYQPQEAGLFQKPCFDLDLRVVVRSSHPLTRKASHDLRRLAECRWVLPRSDTDLYRRLDDDFRRAGATFPGPAVETSSPGATRALVLESDYLAILPLRSVQRDLASGVMRVLSGDWTFQHRTVGLFLPHDSMSPEIRFIRDVLLEQGAAPSWEAGDTFRPRMAQEGFA